MKKLLTLTLIVVMALGLAAPALAYTGNVPDTEGASPYTIEVYLVEHAGLDLLGQSLNLPETDRGYAKNEIIAAIGKLVIPKGEDIFASGYRQLRFKPANVSLAVVENDLANYAPSSTPTTATLVHNLAAGYVTGGWHTWSIVTNDNTLTHVIAGTGGVGAGIGTANGLGVVPDVDRTLRWLVFGKVTDDKATLSFQLRRNAVWDGPGAYAGTGMTTVNTKLGTTTPGSALVLNEDFLVYAQGTTRPPVGPNFYAIHENTAAGLAFDLPGSGVEGPLRFIIETGSGKGKTLALYMFPNGAAGESYRVHVEPSTQHLVFVVFDNASSGHADYDQIKYGTAGYDSLLAFYTEWFEGKLGFSAYNEGNYLTADDWATIAAAAIDISDTVDIEPWTAYVKVPENIVVDPPKTGEAASAAGFITLLLAAAAMVVVKKVRA
jgi:hypothetical protein